MLSPSQRSWIDHHLIAKRTLEVGKIDFAPVHKQPNTALVLVAAAVSLLGSLGADALLVVVSTKIFPSIRGYSHFQFFDYAKLTTVGVLVACAAWPIVTRISSSPRWVFLRMAVLVTLVLFLPDFYILVKGQPVKAVGVLIVMHLAIALVTYNALVHIASTKPIAKSQLSNV